MLDNFGVSVAISGDTVVVGALMGSNATGINGDQSITRSPVPPTYSCVTALLGMSRRYLKASNSDADDQFGSSVAISGDKSLSAPLVNQATRTA